MKRMILPALVTLVSLAILGWLWVNFMPVGKERWDIDPSTVSRSSSPNDFLVAPAGTTKANANETSPVFEMTPEVLLDRFAGVVLAEPKTRELSEPGSAIRTFVQRTPLVGFPDYVTAKAVPNGEGASLIIYSRSQYGHSDLGVNEQRIRSWMDKL